MLDTQIIIHIFEANNSITELSQQYGLAQEKVMLIRIGKLFSNLTKDLIPGLSLTRTLCRQGKSKLEEIEINYIINSSEPQRELAEMFYIAQNTISDIKTGRTHAALPRKPYRKRVFDEPLTQKLSREDVVQILEMLQTHTNAAVANHFNVSKQLISAIRCGRLWTHVPRPPAVKKYCVERGINHFCRKVPKEVILEIARSNTGVMETARKYGVHHTSVTKYRRYKPQELVVQSQE